MASIDHTCIYFHNGMLMKEIDHCDWIERDTAWETSDGKIHTTNAVCLLNKPFVIYIKPNI